MFTNQKISISSIGTPAHSSIKKLFILELGQEPSNRFSDGYFRCIGISVCGMLGVGPWNGNLLGRCGAIWLMLFEAREAGELIADFDYSIPVGEELAYSGTSKSGRE
jgi:hypothetical protein